MYHFDLFGIDYKSRYHPFVKGLRNTMLANLYFIFGNLNGKLCLGVVANK